MRYVDKNEVVTNEQMKDLKILKFLKTDSQEKPAKFISYDLFQRTFLENAQSFRSNFAVLHYSVSA